MVEDYTGKKLLFKYSINVISSNLEFEIGRGLSSASISVALGLLSESEVTLIC